MAHDFTLIAFDDALGSSSLYSPQQCEEAVAAGRIGPATQITVYQGGTSTEMAATDFPLFAALFELQRARTGGARAPGVDLNKPAGPTADDPTERQTEVTMIPRWAGRSLGWNQSTSDSTDAPDTGVRTEIYREPAHAPPSAPAQPDLPRYVDPPRATPAPPQWSTPAPPPFAPPSPPSPPRPPAPAGGSSAKWFLILLLPVLLLLGGIVYVVGDQLDLWDISGGNSSDVVDNGATDPETGLTEQTLYAVREVNVQSGPAVGTPVGTLSRGTALTGVVVPGAPDTSKTWLKIRYGPQTGRYVSTVNLGEATPPSLDTSFSGDQILTVAETPKASAASSASPAPSAGLLAAGTTVSVTGKVNADWAEILLTAGGVGYLPMTAFQAPVVESGPGYGDNGTPPPSDPATNGHQLIVSNQCKTKQLTIAIYYFDGQRWQSNGGATWIYAPGEYQYPVVDGKRLIATSDVIYYAAIFGDANLNDFDGEQYFDYGNARLKMRRANLDRKADGDYVIPFDCS